ncbi:hypothetical protein [Cohnella fermenti]|uniref:Uncharacterized protein n=1 Tax=Cohnella fermenti TaxID=2565925 RepID=A0A4S4BKW4_9BACL|nr:hypothetical protein [Cohnella fermenti]THF75386.1 hypothetical protein E6C55_22340 [Cohnella fermenti]
MTRDIDAEFVEKATAILLSMLKIDLNTGEDESIKLKYINREDIFQLAENLRLLEEYNLKNLNEKLITSGRKVSDFLTEHTFAAELIRNHGWKVEIKYEPQEGRKTDFVIILDEFKEKIFNIQMKNSSPTERENRREKIYQEIKKELKKVKRARFYSISMHEDFTNIYTSSFIEFIKQNINQADNVKIPFYVGNKSLAEVCFNEINNPQCDCMLPGVSGDMNFINITGEERGHFYNALKKAAISFSLPSENNNINLIISEANNKDNIDIAEAIYGAEFFVFDSNTDSMKMSRYENGFYHSEDSRNVTAVVTMRKREESRKISSFSKKIFFKHIHEDAGEAILALLKFDRIIGSNNTITHRY